MLVRSYAMLYAIHRWVRDGTHYLNCLRPAYTALVGFRIFPLGAPAGGLPSRSPGLVFGAVTEGYQEDGAFAFGMRGEEAGDLVVEEGEPGGAESERGGCQIALAAEDAGFELRGAIAGIANTLQDGTQVGEEPDVHRSVRGPLLRQAKVTSIGAEISLL